ncbi:riboflavin synthase [Brumimicrobium glaciale]|uniref:Riboflavin synthase n=1 Tax=Brumimicrobium glaciale TaxID=200475 RepID=A0A4Q4KRX9_9FLAO|nr:riboflavin synthase [Brumimicrobium glaciale]RYM35765.1 riboflavin synthase [Brumimicrobium glaciale]
MFTGIIEDLGEIKNIEREGTNIHFTLTCSFVSELKIDQSLAHNGVCLTVVKIDNQDYTVTAIDETLNKTDLSSWKIGNKVNLERCMPASGRFDGHIVQGHVDTTGECIAVEEKDGSWVFTFQYKSEDMTVEKGSITVNGASLTVVDSKDNQFSVHIIPYTYEHTQFHALRVGDTVNLEFDILGKYIAKMFRRNAE